MRGSIVEVLAWRGRVEFLLLSEPMAREMHWVNGQAVARTYRCVRIPASCMTVSSVSASHKAAAACSVLPLCSEDAAA